MHDDELRAAILEYLEANRTTGAGGAPLKLSDANLATTLAAEVDQFNRVWQSLLDEGIVHGKSRRVQSTALQMDWDYVRLAEDPLPEVDPRELD